MVAGVVISGCSDDSVAPGIEKRTTDLEGFDFVLPCPVADFTPDFLFASNVPRDGIPSVDNPTFSSASETTWLADDDRVLGVVFEGQPMAFPIRILVWHEVVNISGTKGRAAVTYCPLTFTGISLDLRDEFPDEEQTLGVSGLLYNSNLVLYDRKTESLWTQMSGSAYTGAAGGTCLDLIPTMDAAFGHWKRLYPDTKVLNRPGKPEGYQRYDLEPYGDYWANDEILYGIREPLDTRLGAKDWVLGVLADTGAKAYPLSAAPVVNDTLPGVPFVVFNHNREGMVAYKAWVVDGERLTFSSAGFDGEVPAYMDDQTGSKWRFTGECVEGPLSGSVLQRMPSYLAFYFAWWSYFPDTFVHSVSG